jgi:hypothetical protein
MLAQGHGRVINLASQAASVALTDHAAYCASKSGLVGLTKVLASEWAGRGVTANTISPTVVLTDLGRTAWEGAKGDQLKAQIPTGRFAYPEEIAAAAVFLAPDAAAMINGPISWSMVVTLSDDSTTACAACRCCHHKILAVRCCRECCAAAVRRSLHESEGNPVAGMAKTQHDWETRTVRRAQRPIEFGVGEPGTDVEETASNRKTSSPPNSGRPYHPRHAWTWPHWSARYRACRFRVLRRAHRRPRGVP